MVQLSGDYNVRIVRVVSIQITVVSPQSNQVEREREKNLFFLISIFILDWLQLDNNTVYDGLVAVSEHLCHSWTRTIPDVAIFSWLISATTSVPCRLSIPNVMYADIAYYSENADLLPKNIFQVPDYCPREVTDPNCDAMHF